MAFEGRYPNPLQSSCVKLGHMQVSHINHLGSNIYYEAEYDASKLYWHKDVYGMIKKILERQAKKELKLKFYKQMAVHTLLYGSDFWFKKNKIASKIQAVEMKLL